MNKITLIALAVITALGIAIINSPAPAVLPPLPGSTRTIWVSPSGDDSNSGTSSLTPLRTIRQALLNWTSGNIKLMTGDFPVTNLAALYKAGMIIEGFGDGSNIQGYTDLTNGPIIVLKTNMVLRNFRITQMRNSEAIFSAAIGAALQGNNTNFWNALVDNITATNGNTDGVYVKQAQPCFLVLTNSRFISKWDAGAIFTGNHQVIGYDTVFHAIGGSQLNSNLTHGFWATAGTITLVRCSLSGSNSAGVNVGGSDTNNYGVACQPSEGQALLPTINLIGCKIASSGTNSLAFDIANLGYTNRFGVINVSQSQFDLARIKGPITVMQSTVPLALEAVVETTNIIVSATLGLFGKSSTSPLTYTNAIQTLTVRRTSGSLGEIIDDLDETIYTNSAPGVLTNGIWYHADGSGNPVTFEHPMTTTNRTYGAIWPNLTGGVGTNRTFFGNVTNSHVWHFTNNTPSATLPNGSFAIVAKPQLYVRSNGVWIVR